MTTVITAENLSKSYRISHRQSSTTLRDAIANSLKSLGEKNVDTTFWALDDVSFEVKQGEVLGIIGRNGAGKSTLLKILSRITKPTKGRAKLRGRVGSLLEVGTGFHSELTGRENIYLNGAILGMKHDEIKKKFDEIVAFAGYEDFLDTPVKHFSSGMYMRLAFSVAAHLEPEILIVDEVLAVGDIEFQKKCLGKMEEVGKSGRTVIFVSHQLGTIAQLCPETMLLDKGRLVMKGETSAVVEHYISHDRADASSYIADDSKTQPEMFVRRVIVTNEKSEEQDRFGHDEVVRLSVDCVANKLVRGAELRAVVRTARGITVFTTDAELTSLPDNTKFFNAEFTIPADFLRPNSYAASLAFFVPDQHIIESVDDAVFFSIYDAGTKYAHSSGTDYGVVFSPAKWKVNVIE